MIPLKATYSDISTEILGIFGLSNSKLKALLFNERGCPLILSLDYFSLFATGINDSETYVVIFTPTTSSSDSPVPSPEIIEEGARILINFNNNADQLI